MEDPRSTYREASEELRRSLELLEQLRNHPREGGRRRALYRELRRRSRAGFRLLQEGRRALRSRESVGAEADEPGKPGESGGPGESGKPGKSGKPDEPGGQLPEAEEAEERFNRLLLAGGEGLLEREESRDDLRDLVAGALSAALRTYLYPDDRYRPLLRPERMPAWLRRVAQRIFPVLLGAGSGYHPTSGEFEPTGIDDPEEEELLRSEHLRLPLSQAKELLREEVIPALEKRLSGAGEGEGEKDRRAAEAALERARGRLAEFEQIELLPRAKPFVPERGFYTEQITRFSPQGELLVSLRIPGQLRSGTNLDRIRELIKMELVWRLAGRGVCRGLDEELDWVRSMESGSRGSRLFPRARLEVERGFSHLRRSYPVLAALDSREGTRRLLTGAAESMQGGRGGTQRLRRRVRRLLETESLPPPESAGERGEAHE
jgi:hypothetical protein